MKCKFALESYTGHHFDNTSDVLSIVGLETFKNGVVGDIVACMLSHFSSFQLFATHRAPLSIGFSKQEYWSGLPCLSPGDLPDPGIEPASLMSSSSAGRFFTIGATWEAMEVLRLLTSLFGASNRMIHDE